MAALEIRNPQSAIRNYHTLESQLRDTTLGDT
jgi:hypothetical protein